MVSQEDVVRIGRRLAAARMRRGLSQGTVARLAGLAPSYVSRIETGKVQPTFRTFKRLADAIHMPLDEVDETPGGAAEDRGPCPISQSGSCLIDLIRPERAGGRARREQHFTPRQIKILRNFAGWLLIAGRDRQRAVEILLEDLVRSEKADSLDAGPASAPNRKPDA